MQVTGKRHLPLVVMLLILYGLLLYFERTIILNKNVTPAFLVSLYLAAGLIILVLAVNFYVVSARRLHPPYFRESILYTPYYYITLLFFVLCGGLQLLIIWLQTKNLLGDYSLQAQIKNLSGLQLWSFRLVHVLFVPLISQSLFNGLAFSELFTRPTAAQRMGALILIGLLSAIFSGQALGPLLILQAILGILIGLSYLLCRNIVTPVFLHTACNLIFVILYS